MEGKEAIIEKILADGEKEAQEVLNLASEKENAKILSANAWAEEYIGTQKRIIDSEAKDVVIRRRTVANLAVRKIELREKQAVLEETFALALAKLRGVKKAEYLLLTEKNLIDYADEGDQIILSRDKVITAKDVEKLQVFADKKLSVSKTFGDFDGGIKLVGKDSDKDLTFKAIIENARQDMTVKVATKLFGE